MNDIKKTVGIITIQDIPNYGACWQSFALYKYIFNLGYDCEIINLRNPIHKNYRKGKKIKVYHSASLLKRLYRKVLFLFKNNNNNFSDYGNDLKLEKFFEFNKLIKYSKEYLSSDDLYKDPPYYDIYVVGSDQVWNPTLGFDWEAYFMTFAPNNSYKISYAPSFGKKEIKIKYKRLISSYIKDFKYISVREKSGISILKQCTKLPVTNVLDPVFLLDINVWKNIMKKVEYIKEKYLLLFSINVDEELFKISKIIAKERNLKVYAVISTNISMLNDEITLLSDIGPLELLWLIYNADLVCSNSFHGTAMSIILSKAFYSFMKSDNDLNERQLNILNLFELQSHIIWDYAYNPLFNGNLDRNNLNKKIMGERNISQNWLKSALNKKLC